MTSKQCAFCHRDDTPMWRLGPKGQKTLCNACGIRWRRLHRTSTKLSASSPSLESTTSGRSNTMSPPNDSNGKSTASSKLAANEKKAAIPRRTTSAQTKHPAKRSRSKDASSRTRTASTSSGGSGGDSRKRRRVDTVRKDKERDPCLQVLDRLQLTSSNSDLRVEEVVPMLLEEVLSRMDVLQAAQRRTERHIQDIMVAIEGPEKALSFNGHRMFARSPVYQETVEDEDEDEVSSRQTTPALQMASSEILPASSLVSPSSGGAKSSCAAFDLGKRALLTSSAPVRSNASLLASRDDEMVSLEEELARSEKHIAELQQQITRREKQIEALPREVASNWNALIDTLESQIET